MTPSTRTTDRRINPDHDLLVRIDEKLINLIAAVASNAEKTDAKIDKLVMDKADKAELSAIRTLLEEKLPRESFKSTQTTMNDHEVRLRHVERLAFRLGGALALAQIAFNFWVSWKVGG